MTTCEENAKSQKYYLYHKYYTILHNIPVIMCITLQLSNFNVLEMHNIFVSVAIIWHAQLNDPNLSRWTSHQSVVSFLESLIFDLSENI